jgi:CRISPR system Cascade subunit CasA
MTFSFNLIDQPWIPCLRLDGTRDELSLHDLIAQAHQLHEIRGDSPLETAALHRLLLAVLHRVFGPKGWTAWNQLWQRGQFDMSRLDAYLGRKQVRQRFDLFDSKRPFYQSRDPRVSEKSIISMVLEMASGNNATLFDHSTEDGNVALTPAQAARALITSQAFGIGGLSGLPDKFTDAPCAKGIIFLASGDTVFETLMLNLVRYDGEDPIPNDPDDCPSWEMDDPFQPERTQPKGYLDYLTWQNRQIWLFPEQSENGIVVKGMCWAPGLRLDADSTDPMKQYIVDEQEGLHPLLFRSDRALWRDSATLFRWNDKNKPPKVVKWLADLSQRGVLGADRQYRLMALGMAKDRASLDFFRAEALPLSLSFLTLGGRIGDLATALESAEKVGRLLRSTTFILARLILNPKLTNEALKSDPRKEERERVQPLAASWGTERYFWSGLELHFHRLVQDLPQDSPAALKAWRGQLRRAARAAVKQAEDYAGADRRAQRAVVQARDEFAFGLGRILQEPDETQSTNGGEKQ